ncbi:MAG: hypothetical protein ACLGXA_15220 [Acidobacteriota bacterium]
MTAAVLEGIAPEQLRRLVGNLRALQGESEREIDRLVRDFQELALESSGILASAGEIVRLAESERMDRVLPGVRTLAAAAQAFIRQRLEATSGVLETVVAEDALLGQLAQLTRGQKAVVRETGVLRVLTNIEVARLGEVGAGFQYLAHELDDFSQSVARSTSEMMEHTEARRRAIGETRRALAAELPATREGFARIEQSLDNASQEVERALAELRQTPLRFEACVEQVAAQIAGVVAAIQGHDITRQQIEHVESALERIAGAAEGRKDLTAEEMRAGLAIQSYQLRNVRQTIEEWITQIHSCLEGMTRIASSELLSLGPVVMQQESALSAQLTRIEHLEEACEASDSRVQASFAGIEGLMQLVREHLERSRSVRDRLQLLMFNSIVEASHLGSQADGILEISTTIKRISAAWGEITAKSEAATGQIRALVEENHTTREAFSEASYAPLREARAATGSGLETLREAAAGAESQGRRVESAVATLQTRIAAIAGAAERLEAGFTRLGAVVDAIEEMRQASDGPGSPASAGDQAALEARFSAEYTTEIERAVLRAALTGAPLPVAQQSFAGNSVELF